MKLTREELSQINEEISKMTPGELKEFRNGLDTNSMGDDEEEEDED